MTSAAIGLMTLTLLAQAAPQPAPAATRSNTAPRVWKAITFAPTPRVEPAPVEPRPCSRMPIIRGTGPTDPRMPVMKGDNAVDPKFVLGEPFVGKALPDCPPR